MSGVNISVTVGRLRCKRFREFLKAEQFKSKEFKSKEFEFLECSGFFKRKFIVTGPLPVLQRLTLKITENSERIK